jgi:DNA-binding IclR family transcriptional regulator
VVGRASAEGYRAGADAVIPGEHIQFCNDGTSVTELTVVRRRGDRVSRDTLGLAPDDTISLPVPDGKGPVTVEVHAADTMATTAFAAGERPPLFSWTAGALLVARD